MKQCAPMVTFGGDARLRSALFLGLALLTACGGETGIELHAWTLRTGDTSAEVTLPAHLPVPDLPTEYRLTTTVVVPDLIAEACFFWPSMLGRARMTVDGQPTEAIYSSLSQPYRAPGPQLFCVNVLGAGPHRLELVVFHQWLHSAFIEAVPRLLPRAAGERAYRQRQLLIEIGGIFGGTWMSAVGFCYLVLMMRVPVGPPTPLALSQLSPTLRELIEKCVAVEPSLRPSAATLSAALSAQQAALAA